MAFRGTLLPATLILGLLAYVQSAQAVTQTYCGPNVCYQWNDAQAAVTWYGGQPTFVGDSFFWTPTTFEARSADGVGIHSGTNTDTADATWQFSKVWVGTWNGSQAVLNNGNEIASILVHEEGDYEINYADGEVHARLYLAARGLNNLAEATHIVINNFDQVGPPLGLQLWSLDGTLTPAATLTQLANNMTLTIQNTLRAFTNDTTAGSELAWIEKKLSVTVTTTNPVPVPAGLWLLGSAFGVLAVIRRRAVLAS